MHKSSDTFDVSIRLQKKLLFVLFQHHKNITASILIIHV